MNLTERPAVEEQATIVAETTTESNEASTQQEQRSRYSRKPIPPKRMHTSFVSKTFTPPPNSHYCAVALEEKDVAIIGHIMGKDGYYLKHISYWTRVHYIWFLPESSAIGIWGPEKKLPLAVERVKQRIERAHAFVEHWKNRKAVVAEVTEVSTQEATEVVAEVSETIDTELEDFVMA